MTPNATLSIDGAAEIPCSLAVTTQAIEVSSFSGTSSPDLAWTFVDEAGHFHAFDHDGKLPTLETRTVWHAYEEPDEDTGETGYEVSTSHCILCGEEVNAKYVTSFDPGRRLAPGRTEWKLTFTADAPPRFSAVVRTDGRTYFGIAETVYRRGEHHPEEHLAYGGPMSYRPLPVPPWRVDVPVIPEHVTALKDGEGLLWVRRTDDPQLWTRWLGHGVDPSLRLRVGAVMAMSALPLVEHPDPRKATT